MKIGPATLAAALASSCFIAGGAWASTLRHDRDPQAYVDYGDEVKLVGGLTNFPNFGSGVVIHPEWVLTAAHVVAEVSEFGISFETDPEPDEEIPPPPFDFPVSGFFRATQIAIHEYYDDIIGPAGGFDIALVRLDRPVTQYTPWERFRGNAALNPELGRMSTAVGFGATGTGLTGYDLQSGGFARIAGDNTIEGIADDPRVIDEFVSRSVIDPVTGETIEFTQEQIAAQFMMSDFDAPPGSGDFTNPLGSAVPLDLEASVAPGDSGGPVFFHTESGMVIGGINSWIHGLPDPAGDGTDNASYSDLQGYLRISMFNNWIDEVIGIPEPGALAVVAMLAMPLMLRRRSRRTPTAP